MIFIILTLKIDIYQINKNAIYEIIFNTFYNFKKNIFKSVKY